MATRERKAKLSAESPTPSAGNESTPTTPTNASAGGGKGGRKVSSGGASVGTTTGRVRSTRGTNAQQVAEEGELEKEKEKTEENAEVVSEPVAVKTPRTPRASRATTTVAQKAAEAKAAEAKAAEAKAAEAKAAEAKAAEAKAAEAKAAEAKAAEAKAAEAKAAEAKVEETKEASEEKGDDASVEVKNNEEAAGDAADEESQKTTTSSPRTLRKSATPTAKGSGGKRRRRVKRDGVVRPRAIMKRKTMPAIPSRSASAAAMVTRRNSIAKIEAIAKAIKEETVAVRKSTRTRRKTKIADEEPVKRKRKRMMSEQEKVEEPPKEDAEMKQPEKVTKSEVLSDTELIRRRSDSVSKYSDTTDNSSFYDAATFKSGPEEWGRDSNATPKVDAENEEVKVENVEMEEESTAAEAKPAAVKEETKVEETETVRVKKKRQTILVRRSRRARKSTQKESEVEVAAVVAKTAKVAENKTDGSESVMNSVEDTDVNTAKGAPLHVETVVKESTAVDDEAKEGNEEVDVKKTKASSLSPELVSEGVSPISVQQFYGQPAFLENNLGIEEDPKLREIVQVKEKIKQVESTETQEDAKEEMKMEEKVEKVEEKEEESEIKEIVNGTTEDEIKDDLKTEEDNKPEEKEIVMDTEEKKEEAVEEEVPKVEEVEEENKNTEDITETIAENLDSNEATEDQSKTNDKENVVSNGEAPQQMEKDDKLTMVDDTSKSPLLESPETRLKKECHLKSLGLLTHEAAVEAKIEKARRREFFKSTANNSSLSSASSTSSGSSVSSQQSNGTRNGKSGRGHGGGQEYTGTLKTVIKLHRPQSQEKRKTRMPLKMTFQKGRVKSANSGNDKDQVNLSNSDDDTYYTIQNETDGPNADTVHGGISRKTHYRSHTGDSAANTSVSAEPSKEVQKALVIPEKASSFSIHPGRLCQDQCFYCGGKFGLFDTPCHVAQIKSLERQKKILDNEEKLTVDNCLCDACYRHVDRRANCPSYRNKRQSAALATSDYNKEETAADSIQHEPEEVRSSALCLVTGCGEASSHLLRRKWFSKMRKPINKLIRLNVDVSNAHGLGQVPICHKHYDIISHLMVCVLCKRKLPRNHIFYINQEIKRLEQLIRKQGIPVILGTNAVVCKLCRYYTNLLLKPPDRKTQRAQFVRSYRRRLLSFHNVEMLEASDDKEGGDQRTQPAKRRGRKSPDEEQENDQELSDQNDSSQNTSGQIVLDNDVMVDYDVPVLDGGAFAVGQKGKQQQQKMQSLLLPRNQQLREKQQRLQAIQKENEISRMLRTNPNISMRELFPGEDEMGLQVYLPFGQGGHRTPEGWTRATSILQYDDATKMLWEELQKPYGNQSSFIRHLVLLEKYFRNGDLILSPAASSNAVTYSESVQNRLKSFDNVTSDSLSIFHQLSNAPITITPANPKGRTSSGARYSDGASGSSTSLLKSNNTRKEDGFGSPDKGYSKSQEGAASGGVSIIKKSSAGGIPPDLISITTTPSNKSSAAGIDTITVTATGGQKGTSPPVAGATPSPPPNTVPPHVNPKDVIVKLPESLSPAERRLVNGKAWRPTLMPIAPLERDSSRDGVNTLYQTADGRLLPSRVQVMSGGKPYHISIYDYNRMCILRREKILQKAMAAQQGKPENGQKAGGSGGGERSPPSQQPTASTSKGKVSIPNKILEQNSVLPIGSKSSGTTSSSELQSLIKVRKPNPTSLLKNQIPIAPKPPVQQQPSAISAIVSLSTTTTMPNANPMMSIIDLMKTTTSSPSAATSMWLLNEPLNGPATGAGAIVTDTSAASLLSKIPKSLTVIPQQKGSRSGSRVSSGEDQSSA
ncbi:uncharacterized protein LOC129809588 isoform X1 [Phlebotomus papatasi]|uniref:uncharacterized protein LOC129809588 isoform X1 n=1 Tax=Phlebotomus papatasi TaxID=29031 RepID=UPI00248366EF|nr:uncharacterized protein LOC129809588 isoform X1 [Phlebotomus papatasi]